MVNIYTADPAALVVNGRMYIYTGHDEASATQQNFVMRGWRVSSSATPSTDRAVSTDHGSRLSVANFRWAGADAWAAEVEPRDGLVGAVTEPAGLFGFWEATGASCRPGELDDQPPGHTRAQRPVVDRLPHRGSTRWRQLPALSGRRPGLLQR